MFLFIENVEKAFEATKLDISLVLFLLEHYFFYATSHETAFIHIRWESGFHGFQADSNNPIIRFIMALFILFNTFSGVLICSAFLLLCLSETADKHKSDFALAQVFTFCILNAIKVTNFY